ncbi:WYL domain-containing protein [Methylomonas sp. LL1]|uniref:helix-turn-helix transcriptional regulator n=1 Tax=Methylomonas sp. LL1 TaxID=2785785 RepID=UPI0018C3F2D9|nr:WYL domain-containing protein [Methylomonas sp. LL1]QPK64048.1 WYL domain-containing protein [Methylomonas sp. LL1]
MPDQKSQAVLQRRLLVLESIRRLSGRSERWVTVGEIVNDLQQQGYAVETHSIRRDMKSLLETYPQLECNDNSQGNGEAKAGLAHGYRWVGKDAQLQGGITLPEALSLVMVERYLSQSLPVLLTRPLQDIFTKAHQTLELHKKSQITHWPEKICVIQPAQPLIPPEVRGEILEAVHDALLNEKQLRVSYHATQKVDAEPKAYRLHPLGLIQRGPITYLAAMANEYEDVYLYALHRMLTVEVLADDCRGKNGFDLHQFAQRQGHFGTASPIRLEAKIRDHLALILQESPLSENQIVSEADSLGFKLLTADVLDTWQLRWWIMGEADRIEVISPSELRQDIQSMLTKAHQHYV